jgi:uncharacterized protein
MFDLQKWILTPKMQGMLKRFLTDRLQKSMAQYPAVALLGARQVGKTTLAKTIAKHQNSIYLDLEAPEDLLKLSDPGSYLSGHGDKLVILDEIQRAPDLFGVLRGIIDRNRERGRKAGQFLLLGSASMDLLRQSSESLAGRISYIEMSGLNVLETGHHRDALLNLWFRGGFPDSYLADDDALAMDWQENLIRTYLERDVPQMGFRVPANRLRRLWTMLAHNQGETANCSKLGGNLEIDGKTVSHYIDILVDLLLVRRLEPWHNNVKKRLIKSRASISETPAYCTGSLVLMITSLCCRTRCSGKAGKALSLKIFIPCCPVALKPIITALPQELKLIWLLTFPRQKPGLLK